MLERDFFEWGRGERGLDERGFLSERGEGVLLHLGFSEWCVFCNVGVHCFGYMGQERDVILCDRFRLFRGKMGEDGGRRGCGVALN